MADGGERDMRFLFCAAAICRILADDCSQGMDVNKATAFVTNSLTYEGDDVLLLLLLLLVLIGLCYFFSYFFLLSHIGEIFPSPSSSSPYIPPP